MKDSFVMKLCSTLPVLMLASHLSYAMPGMHGTEGSGATERRRHRKIWEHPSTHQVRK